MTKYQVGTVAIATVRGRSGVKVIRCVEPGGDSWFMPSYMSEGDRNGWWPGDDEVTDIQPLVTVDMRHSNPECIPIVLRALRDAGCYSLADQIQEQAKPAKPEEPTGLGAVVEDAEGEEWVRVGGPEPWRHALFNDKNYAGIDAPVKIVSEGVSA